MTMTSFDQSVFAEADTGGAPLSAATAFDVLSGHRHPHNSEDVLDRLAVVVPPGAPVVERPHANDVLITRALGEGMLAHFEVLDGTESLDELRGDQMIVRPRPLAGMEGVAGTEGVAAMERVAGTQEVTADQRLAATLAQTIQRVWVFAPWSPAQRNNERIMRRLASLPATDCVITVYHQWLRRVQRDPNMLADFAARVRSERDCDVHFLIYPQVDNIGQYSDVFIPIAEDGSFRSILLDLENNWRPVTRRLGLSRRNRTPDENVARFLNNARNRQIYDDFNNYFVQRMTDASLPWGVYSYGFIPLGVVPFARLASYIAPDAQGGDPAPAHRIWRRYTPNQREVIVLPGVYRSHNHQEIRRRLAQIPTLTNPAVTEVAFWALNFFFGTGRGRTRRLINDLIGRIGPSSRPW